MPQLVLMCHLCNPGGRCSVCCLECCWVNLSHSPVVAHAEGAPGQVILSADFRQSCSAEAVAVVQCLLTLDYKLRPSARQALTIPWVDQEGLDYKEHIQGLPQALASVSSFPCLLILLLSAGSVCAGELATCCGCAP